MILDKLLERPTAKGLRGELHIARILQAINEDQNSEINGSILRNLYLPAEDGETTEVDLVYITTRAIFVIESKYYEGWIYGDENHPYWTVSYKKKRKENFYNPIWQNKKHIEAIQKIIGEDKQIYSLIVFGEFATLRKITVSSIGTFVLELRELKNKVKNLYLRDDVDSIDVSSVTAALEPYLNASDEVRKKHIEDIKEKL